MGDFFRGWRRKIGVVTLLLACVFTGWWVRSLARSEMVGLTSNEYIFSRILSYDGIIDWDWASSERHTYRDPLKLAQQITALLASERENSSELKLRGVGRHRFRSGDIALTIWRIPYWLIVVPLTAISAYLLLTKPRPTIQKKLTEPFPEKLA